MRDRHEPGRPAGSGIEELPEDRRDALRASLRSFLVAEPERDERGVEIYLTRIELAIRSYLAPNTEEPGIDSDPMQREELALELDSVAAQARSLTSAVETLSAYSRDRLSETTRLDREALDHLLRLCSLAEAEAAAARRQMLAEPHGDGTASRDPELVLLEELAVVWTHHTDQRILRDREAQSPWARFVEVACGIAGIERESAHRVRVRVYDSAGLSESAELLESLPDL